MDFGSIQSLMETPLGQVVEKTNQVFFVYSADLSKVLYISPNYEKIWRHSNAKLYDNPKAFLEPIHPDDIERVNISIEQLVNKQNFDEEYRIILPDQTVRWIHGRGYPILDASGNIECLAGIAEDITERKADEEALRESEEKFQQFANHVDIVFWLCTPDVRQYYYMSPYYEKLWCKTRSSLYEEPHSFLEAVHPDDLERVTSITVGDKAYDINEEYRIIRPDGSIKWVRDRTFPIQDRNGNVYRMVGIAEDITESKQAQAEVFKALQRERELSDAKSHFIATTSHEIRTPLAIIQSSFDILQNYDERLTKEKKQRHFKKIESSVKRISKIVEDILLIAEENAGTLQYELIDVDTVKLCQEVITAICDDSKINKIDFKVSGNSSPTIKLDTKLFNHILNNLLENAIKYSRESSRVEFEINLSSDNISFRVSDQGIGIDSNDLPHIFSSFYRASNAIHYPGTGLGLAIVKQCVDLHKGNISVESDKGVGTTFSVTIPR